MKIELLKEWMGNAVNGRPLDLLDWKAKELISRGTARRYKPKKKQVKAAPRDKMVRGAAAK